MSTHSFLAPPPPQSVIYVPAGLGRGGGGGSRAVDSRPPFLYEDERVEGGGYRPHKHGKRRGGYGGGAVHPSGEVDFTRGGGGTGGLFHSPASSFGGQPGQGGRHEQDY